MSLSFAFPAALLLLVLVPLAAWLFRRANRALPLPRAGAMRAGEEPRIRLPGRLPEILRGVTLTALVLGIAGPTFSRTVVEEKSLGVPIVLAVDISSSMLARDFQPLDRLEVAKATLTRFVEGRPNDPIALVAFAAEALTLVPATTHRAVLLSSIESLRVGMVEDGTAVGDGLAVSINRLQGLEKGGVVVLLTDGESNRGTIDARDAADAAAAFGIRVYTVGVGSEGVAQVPVEAAPAGFRYSDQRVGLDAQSLEEIAARTGGRYFHAADPDALTRIYGEIDELVPSIVETTPFRKSTSWSGWLILIAGSALAAEWLLRGSRWGALP